MKRICTLFLTLGLLFILNACQTQSNCTHQYTAQITREATCSVEGVKTHTCTLCGHTKTEAISKKNHYYLTEITKEATCDAEGVKTLTCSRCGDSKTEAIAKISHNYTSQITTAATCSNNGIKTYTCKGCGDSYTETIAKTSHNYTSKITTAATCSNNGTKTHTCKDCGDSYTETIAKTSHNYTSKITTAATCSNNGTKTYTCKGCGDSYKETIYSSGHSWVSATCTKAKHCSTCGTTSGSALGHNYSNGKCTRCGSAASATIILPSTPKTISYYGYSGKLYTTCKVTAIQVDLSSASSSGLWYEITFVGTCTYNTEGNNQSTSMKIGYKLYDSDDFVVNSGTAYSESVSVGEKFKETINVYYLEPGKTYTLVISHVN